MPIVIEVLFTVAKRQKQPERPSTEEYMTKHGVYTQWNNIQQ